MNALWTLTYADRRETINAIKGLRRRPWVALLWIIWMGTIGGFAWLRTTGPRTHDVPFWQVALQDTWVCGAIILFGISTTAILFVIILGAAPSIANGLIAGVDYTPPLLLKVGATMGLRRFSLYRHLILPASLPAVIVGLRQGWAFAWRSLMAGELLVIIANQPSLGVLLSSDQDQADMQSATAIIIVILIVGILVHTLFSMADRSVRRRWGLTGNI